MHRTRFFRTCRAVAPSFSNALLAVINFTVKAALGHTIAVRRLSLALYLITTMSTNNLQPSDSSSPTLSVSFRGKKIELSLHDERLTIHNVVEEILRQTHMDSDTQLQLLFQGKRLTVNSPAEAPIRAALEAICRKKLYKVVATGISAKEAHALQEQLESAQRTIRIRDDLTPQGQAQIAERQRLGQYMMNKIGSRNSNSSSSSSSNPQNSYRFERIETLPNLPDEEKARSILFSLANDPGVLACMRLHKWTVGALCELFPDGKVGQSAVCVMGLNQNKGQRILLRIRTDDLKGFRKIASIRKVLYHELAHNVYSEHDTDFFQLMRQIERECTSMDWTRGAGVSSQSQEGGTAGGVLQLYTGGVYRLGSGDSVSSTATPLRELAAQAALSRMTKEEEEIEQNCGCGRNDLFLPKPQRNTDTAEDEDSRSAMETKE